MVGVTKAVPLALAIFSCILSNHLLLAEVNKSPIELPATTPLPITTSTGIHTTTDKPTTLKPTDKTTTAKPTTPKPPPPPPSPKKYPQNIGTWAVQDQKNNVTCILLKGAIQIAVNFTATGSNKSQTALVDIPEDAKVGGSCTGPMDQNITLQWPVMLQDNTTKENNLVTLAFHKQQISSGPKPEDIQYSVAIKSITATLYKDMASFPNASDPSAPLAEDLGFKALRHMIPLGNYFGCKAESSFVSENNSTFSIKFQSLEFQAFAENLFNHTEFLGKETSCPQDSFKIGGLSAGMVFGIIVLILAAIGLIGGGLYLFKRQRGTTGRAYENM